MTDTTIQSTQKLPDGLLATIIGDIDLARSPALRLELLDLVKQKPKRLVVDLSGVPYMDSSGVATLIEALQHQRKAGAKMVLCGLQAKVRSIFEIARLDAVFKIVPDCEAAKTV